MGSTYRAVFVGLAAVLGAPGVALSGNEQVRIEEVLAGVNGDSSIQFIEIAVTSGDNEWGPQPGGDPASRALLEFYDGAGDLSATFEFDGDPNTGASGSVVIATQAFLDAYAPGNPGFADFILPAPYVVGVDGMVCFRDNPANQDVLKEPVDLCVSYGDYQGPEQSDNCPVPTFTGPPAEPRDVIPSINDRGLPIAVDENAPTNAFPLSLNNASEVFGCLENGNADFSLDRPTPHNSANETIPSTSFVAAPNTEQGQNLFALETFDGNGRTCQTCHRPEDGFGLSPTTIATLFDEDPNGPLFVHLPPSTFPEIEDDCLLRSNPRGLILENIDNFGNPAVFRSTPHLIGIANTAPYGMGFCPGPSCSPTPKIVMTLDDFCLGAIEQHAPKTVARNSDPGAGPLDFRFPTDFELEAMETFQNDIDFPEKPFLGATGLESADALIAETLVRNPNADVAAIMAGRSLFFGLDPKGNNAKCSECHNGPVLAINTGSFTDPMGSGIPDHFEIGTGSDGTTSMVTNPILGNRETGCSGGEPATPGDPLAAEGSGGSREFNTMPLVGIMNTAPFFHDGSSQTMMDAVRHYQLAAFNTSSAGVALGGISINGPEQMQIVAFLDALTLPAPGAAMTQVVALAALSLLARRRRSTKL